ncbi:MAG: hypothetical protein COZ25_08765 [Ignavibacteria bacterium CG_4_10_14_3_um_filter_37_18]|nr:MAG: hypothetical protein COZ25_08765 [Ignavibacteria bacterium CG_4_10_14_3_um_filter_37_18]
MDMKEFMATISLPEVISEEYIERIPAQKEYIGKLVSQKKITSYALSSDKTKLWRTFSVNSKEEIRELLLEFPLYLCMEIEIDGLLFHENTKLLFPQLFFN